MLLASGLWVMLLSGCSGTVDGGSLPDGPPLVEISVAHVPGEPLPAEVISGRLEDAFIPVRGAVLSQPPDETGWWRVRVHGDVAPDALPQLVVLGPHQASVEAWLPGNVRPSRHGMGDGRLSLRVLAVPLASGLRAGDAVYLRVRAPLGHSMRVRIDPLAAVHRADLLHVAWRSAGLAGLGVMAVLALGLWFGVREAIFGLLALALASQAVYFAASGGEALMSPALAWLAWDPRLVHLSGLLALLATMVFAGRYLGLARHRPALVPVFRALGAALCALALAVLVIPSAKVLIATSVVAAAMATTVVLAALAEAARGRRPALFLLVAWLPMTALLLAHLAELNGAWLGPPWLGYALPASCVLSGLVVMTGLGETLHKLRRDRDDASRMASYDLLTGGLSRPAIEARLGEAVHAAHSSGMPLSVVFFDIDHFKQVNDVHGHLMGDQCIRIIAVRARNRLRTYDLFGRWGGDEILVLLPDTPLDEAVGMAENLRSAVNCRSLEIEGTRLEASLSLGVAQLMEGESADQLVRRADEALYASKQAGRDRVSVSRWAGLRAGSGAGVRASGARAPAVDRS